MKNEYTLTDHSIYLRLDFVELRINDYFKKLPSRVTDVDVSEMEKKHFNFSVSLASGKLIS